jgi:ATP-dependent DNA ligase
MIGLGGSTLIVTLKLHQEHFVLDGETVVVGPDGVSDFAALHSGGHNERAQLGAFDMLSGDGEDHRRLPLSLRKINLARLLKRRIPAYSSRVRAGRNHRLEAPRLRLRPRQMQALGQDEEPRASGL